MLFAKRLAFVIPVLALLACGGSVVKVGPGGGDGGGDDGPDNGCPSPAAVGALGAVCSDIGQVCEGTVVFDQCGSTETITTQCTCASGTWACPVAISGGCVGPITPCPVPSSITPNGACTTSPQLSCQSDIPVEVCNGQSPYGNISCNCVGGAWQCLQAGPACPVEAGSCPSPDTTYAGQACDLYGTTCGGDPQICGGTTVYDGLQCQGGVWTVVAATFCDVDAGFTDAEGPDGGKGI